MNRPHWLILIAMAAPGSLAACRGETADPEVAREFRFDERLGVAEFRSGGGGRGCLSVVDPWLTPGTPITLVSWADSAEAVFNARVVTKSYSLCVQLMGLGNWVGPRPTLYEIALLVTPRLSMLLISVIAEQSVTRGQRRASWT